MTVSDPDAPRQLPLDQPRPLSDDERALLDALLAGPRSRPELVVQVCTAQIVGECSCGCPSVWIRADADLPALVIEAEESPTGDPAYYSLTAHGRNNDAQDVQVTLHVTGGRVEELEIWSGAPGPTTLPLPATLRYSEDD